MTFNKDFLVNMLRVGGFLLFCYRGFFFRVLFLLIIWIYAVYRCVFYRIFGVWGVSVVERGGVSLRVGVYVGLVVILVI